MKNNKISASQKKKEWYQKPWGVIVAILILPFFAIWYAWAKSNWSKNLKMGVTAASVLFVVVALATSPDTTTKTNTKTPSQTTAPISQETPKPTQPAKPKEWVQVVTFSGDAKKRSAPFTLSGADARLKYTQTGSQYATAYVYIVKQGESLEQQGGFPEISIEGNKTDETRLAKSAGSYYFDVNSVGANWTVSIEEYR